MVKKFSILFILAVIFQSCGNPSSSELNYNDGLMYYKGKPYTGMTENYSEEGILESTEVYNEGLMHEEKDYNADGSLSSEVENLLFDLPVGQRLLLISRKDYTNTGILERHERCRNVLKNGTLTIEKTIEWYDWCGELKRRKIMISLWDSENKYIRDWTDSDRNFSGC